MSIDLSRGIPYAPLRRRGKPEPESGDSDRKARERPTAPAGRATAVPGNHLTRNILLAFALGVAAFFWIWLYQWTGAKAYWVAPVAFAVSLAVGPTYRSLPFLALSGVGGVLLGLVTFAASMLVLPLYYGLSWAIAGALIVLVAGLLSVPRMRETLPMLLVGWGCFLGAMARFDYLILEKPIEALPRALSTFAGVLLSVLVGVLLAAALSAFILKPGSKAHTEAAGAQPGPAGGGERRGSDPPGNM